MHSDNRLMNGSYSIGRIITMAKSEKITKEKIILAFLDSCFEKNAGGTSLADVAGKLGIKKASLYNHYSSRDAMIEDCIRWCGEYYKKTYFIPADIDAIAQKYPAENVLKAIVNRWFRLNEKEPFCQIHSFIESEKYISNSAATVSAETRKKLTAQTVSALKSLVAAGKIPPQNNVPALAEMMTSMMNSSLEAYLVNRKIQIRSNPETGEDSLFSVPIQSDFSKIDTLIEAFCALLKQPLPHEKVDF